MNYKTRISDILRRFARGRRGNVAVMFALMLVPLVGAVGLATETSSWFLTQRATQYAADQAALAAATNGCDPDAKPTLPCVGVTPSYKQEAAAVAQRYSLVNGTNDTTVTASSSNSSPPPSPLPAACAANDCFVVSIQRRIPYQLLRVVGFTGDTTTAAGAPAQTVFARAVALRQNTISMPCITALGSDTQSFRVNGGAQLDLTGCPIYTPNGGAVCNGKFPPMVSYVANPGKSNDNCGLESVSPLSWDGGQTDWKLARNLSGVINACNGKFPQAVRNGQNANQVDVAHQLRGSNTYSASSPLCGDVQLVGNLTISADSTLVIENGRLDLNGFTLSTSSGAHLTLIFSGDSTVTSASHYPMTSANGGVLDFSAPGPNSGTWSGIAIYQDPTIFPDPTNLPAKADLNFTVAGNTPQFDITGLIYAPLANIQISGAINHATAGLACLSIIANTITISGTAAIFANPTIDCQRAGVISPDVAVLQKAMLVG